MAEDHKLNLISTYDRFEDEVVIETEGGVEKGKSQRVLQKNSATTKSSEKSDHKTTPKRSLKYCDTVVVVLGLMVTVALFAIPTIFFALSSSSNKSSTCEEQLQLYSGQVCADSPNQSDYPVLCSEGFFLDQNETGFCRPECGQFGHIKNGLAIIERVSVCTGLLASLTMFVLALTIQRSVLLVFPTVHLVYLCGTMFLLTAVIVVGFFDNTKLFCGSSHDQFLAIEPGNETPYCTITGVVFNYCSMQLCMWLVFHVTFLFLAINFPFWYQQLKLSGRIKYAHTVVVLLALTIPLPGALLPLKDGYFAARNPTIICTGRSTVYRYYTYVLPISIILGITMYLLILTCWKIIKKLVIKKLKAETRRRTNNVGKAEVKIIIVILYFTLMGIMGLMSISFYEFNGIKEHLVESFLCENMKAQECNSRKLTSFSTFAALSVVATSLFTLAPIVAIIFSFDRRKILCKC